MTETFRTWWPLSGSLFLAAAILASAAPADAQAAGVTVNSTLGRTNVLVSVSPNGPAGDDETDESLFTSFDGTATASSSAAEGSASATAAASGSLSGGFNDLTSISANGSGQASFTDNNPDQNVFVINSETRNAVIDVSFRVPAPGVTYSLSGSASASSSGGTSCARAFVDLDSTQFVARDGSADLDFCGGPASVPISASGTLAPGDHQITARGVVFQESKLGSGGASANASWSFTLSLGQPDTAVAITSGPSGTVAVPDARFEFSTTDPSPPPGRFECRLDGGGADPFTPCLSPLDFSGLADGEHLFEVRYHPDGEDPGPVTQRRWTIDTDDCPDVPIVQVGFATAQGCFTETEPDSGVFETAEKAWVGGFQIEPRGGGRLVLDTNTPGLSTTGTGADIVFAGFKVPIPVEALPVGSAEATVQFGGGAGTVAEVLEIPVEASVKVAWTDGGRSATYEQKLAIKKLTESIGPLVTPPGTVLGDFGGALKAKLENGIGFVLEQGELRIDRVALLPDKLKVKRQLELRDLLLRFERKDDRPFWTGRGGITLPLARGDLGFTATVFVFDGSPAGGGLAISGINKQLGGTPLFLQDVSGDLLFAPRFGHDLAIKGSLGPRVAGKQLLTISGQMKGGELITSSDCPSGDDPEKLLVSSKLTPLEPLELAGLASSTMSLRSCVYPYAGLLPAMDATATIAIEFAGGALAYEASQTGFISKRGANLEGAAQLTLPVPGLSGTAVGDRSVLSGSAIISTKGTAACATVGFLDAGFGHLWGQGVPSVFTGCDLKPFRVVANGAVAKAAGAAAGAIEVPKGLPHAGFAATAQGGAPRVTVSGPGGLKLSSPVDGSVLRTSEALILPVADEKTTYVFVREPRAGDWRVEAADPANPLTKVSFAEGLDDAKVKGKVAKGKKGKLRLRYSLREIEGQKVTLFETGEGIYEKLGKARGDGGSIAFKPTLSTDRKRTIEAEVSQDGLPRELITVARFKAPALPKLRKPDLEAKRRKSSLTLSWARVQGASDYLVEVRAGDEALFRVLTPKRRLRFDDTPATGRLAVTAQALSESQPPGPVAKLKVKPPR